MQPSRHHRLLIFWLPLGLFVVAASVMGILVTGLVREFQFHHRSRATLLDIQRAVQDYHVALEYYPKKSPMTGTDLVAFLTQTGHLKTPPLNPWTGTPYGGSQPDGIRYRTDELAETYSLESLDRGLTPEPPLWQIDSTEHRSLE